MLFGVGQEVGAALEFLEDPIKEGLGLGGRLSASIEFCGLCLVCASWRGALSSKPETASLSKTGLGLGFNGLLK